MKRLIVMRHGKSSWADPGQLDHDRPLNKRGRRSATLVGRWLADNGYLPDRALVSTSLRTRETWDGVAAAVRSAPAEFVQALYHASPEAMLAVIRRDGAGAERLLVLGHQPGIGAFAAALLADPPSDADFHRYPTGATAIIDLGAERWSDAAWGAGRLADFVIPRALE